MIFKDHFSDGSENYSRFRPRYSTSLFAYLASECAQHDLAWDCATGSGQAALGLADHFTQVIATDASASQILHAARASGVAYAVAPAESSGLRDNSVDLVTVAQSLHWFDLGRFSAEVERVLKVQGVLSAWVYGLLSVDGDLDRVIEHLYNDIVGEYWPVERKMVEVGYSDVNMPFDEIPTQPFEISATWRFSDLIGYLNTWSAVRIYKSKVGGDPLALVHEDLLREWGDPDAARTVTWPVVVRVWRKTHSQ